MRPKTQELLDAHFKLLYPTIRGPSKKTKPVLQYIAAGCSRQMCMKPWINFSWTFPHSPESPNSVPLQIPTGFITVIRIYHLRQVRTTLTISYVCVAFCCFQLSFFKQMHTIFSFGSPPLKLQELQAPVALFSLPCSSCVSAHLSIPWNTCESDPFILHSVSLACYDYCAQLQ